MNDAATPLSRVKRLARAVRRRLGRSGPKIDWKALHLEPLAHLDTILSLPDLDGADLNPIGHRLDDAIRADPARAAKALQMAFHAYQGPVTPGLNRLIIHALDAEWRSHSDQADKGRALRRKLHRLEARFGPVPGVLLYRGALALRSGDRETAVVLQAQAAANMGALGLPWMHIGAHALRPDAGRDWCAGGGMPPIAGTTPGIRWVTRPAERGEICLLAGGDGRFFRAYGPGLHASLRAVDATCNMHFHIVNFTPGCAAALEAMDDPRLSVTTEAYPAAEDRTYFAAVRFYRLPEIIAALDMPVYITDLDNAVTQAPTEACAAFQDCDLALHSQASQTWFPWWGPSAANTYVSAGSTGRKLARWMQDYLALRLDPGDPFRSWWVDQLMLNEVGVAADEAGYTVITSRVPERTLTGPAPGRLEIRAKLVNGDFDEMP